MDCFELQPWLTIRGMSNIATVVQSEHEWADMSEFRDVVLWTEVALVPPGSGTAYVTFETAPSKDETLFQQAVAPFQVQPTNGTAVYVSVVHRDLASVPIAQWLRWNISQQGFSPTWSVVFRIWAAGMRNTAGSMRGPRIMTATE